MATNTGPIPKPRRRNPARRNDSRWDRCKRAFRKTQVKENGWYVCDTSRGYGCGRWIQSPEVDHIIKRSVAPHLKYDHANLQILCHECHLKKDGGMVVK